MNIQRGDPWAHTGEIYLTDSEDHITQASSILDNSTNCTSTDYDTCTSYLSVDLLATSCFPQTTITICYLSVGRRLPNYANTDCHEFDLRLMSQCAKVR